jgi:hypothetical protein
MQSSTLSPKIQSIHIFEIRCIRLACRNIELKTGRKPDKLNQSCACWDKKRAGINPRANMS